MFENLGFNGLLVLSVVISLVLVVFYLLFVRTVKAKMNEGLKDLRAIADSLEVIANKIK